jgi:hypothetical protein
MKLPQQQALSTPCAGAAAAAAAAAVLRGMGTVYKVEQLGSSSGKTSGRAVIVDSGELPKHWRPKSSAPEPPGPEPSEEDESG